MYSHALNESCANDRQRSIERMMCDDREYVAVPRVRADARAGEEPIASDVEDAPALRQDLSELLLDFVDDWDVSFPETTLVAPREIGIEPAPAPERRYCSSCRKHLVETHFRSRLSDRRRHDCSGLGD